MKIEIIDALTVRRLYHGTAETTNGIDAIVTRSMNKIAHVRLVFIDGIRHIRGLDRWIPLYDEARINEWLGKERDDGL